MSVQVYYLQAVTFHPETFNCVAEKKIFARKRGQFFTASIFSVTFRQKGFVLESLRRFTERK